MEVLVWRNRSFICYGGVIGFYLGVKLKKLPGTITNWLDKHI